MIPRQIIILLTILLVFSCSSENPKATIKISETVGVDRDLEYVEVHWSVRNRPNLDDKFSLSSREELIEGQILDVKEILSSQFLVRAIFPITIKANTTKAYSIISEGSVLKDTLKIKGNGIDLTVENNHFIADLTAHIDNNTGVPFSSGEVRSLTLKKYNNQLLQRTGNNMHWSPNFQSKEFDDYSGLCNVMSPDSAYSKIGVYKTTIYKEGKVEGYPEITIKGTYEFYAGLPYYIFSSEVKMNQDITLSLLRNDEMTIDSLFTDLIYKDKIQSVNGEPLYGEHSLEKLETNPITDDAPWLAFYNKDLNYSYGCIRLEYNNLNEKGEQSPFYEPYTKISKGRNGGRYWNRKLIYGLEKLVPKGSKYHEKNAYFIFDVRMSLVEQIENLNLKLNNPLKVTYNK